MTPLDTFGIQMDIAQVGHGIARLGLAAVLGGAIGIEREMRHKAAGLRTQLSICLGSAFFSILSVEMAHALGGDPMRIAAQIIPGIGFIGAGTILHTRGSVTGLTTAASMFVVASIGMAAGGGLYVLAILVTILALLALFLLGWLEARLGAKPAMMIYDVFGKDLEEMLAAVDQILETQQQGMGSVQFARSGQSRRLQFKVNTGQHEHRELLNALRVATAFERVQCTAETNRD